ncbi:putative lipoprotein YgdR [Klebsiella spallanzanii]|uniref:Lipoprotein YgdR n=4 Tax=Klebsiella TaxID=570 RepID=A0A564HH87_9ENTR|nr:MULTISPECIES: YgdI/YgdR family lipoprotein [Klebsiella]MBA7933691.1 YgdI/YgdR family lipoprotein [Klebsiella sp. RHBSTW-00215]MDG1643169.1 YgdI/YgdR family lipoprotein [Klebsiella huaxiensis]MDM4206554.1 YgdI/YgdR family lipoprotein [Klebsiella spallanzanii]QBG08424.1 YgdI/YgdR family lipoprotein [Klebsiella huaxiensis]VUS31964.1 putative lipoprotein YgdR [Klebsiella spallanzanii]
MKKSLMVVCAGAMLALLAGCSSNYVMTTKSGQTIVTQGKPKLDKDTGMTSYTDESGNQRQINSSDVAQLVEDN